MRRTEPQRIGAFIDELFKSPNIAAKIAEGSLPNTWREVVGEMIAAQTRQVRLVKGTLYVHVQSGVVRQELMLQRMALVNALNAKAGMAIVKNLIVQ